MKDLQREGEQKNLFYNNKLSFKQRDIPIRQTLS